ncbi:MAG TPA: hypothetical protein IAC03_07690 [Candidatus Coprenecus pullistercoris]|nr:hypothetical protein [Candidatus Coprenecus pullistercoris]
MRQILIITASLILCLVQSCIWEDRSGCPTYLRLDLSNIPDTISHINLAITGNGNVMTDTVMSKDFNRSYEVRIKRGHTRIAAFGNTDRMTGDKEGLRIERGNDADNIYTCFISAVYDQDLSFDTLYLHKNNIGLHIRIFGEASDSLNITVKSTSVGYGLDGRILTGEFLHHPSTTHYTPPEGKAYFEFFSRITRQSDESLSITVFSTSRTPAAVILLSGFLEEAGIDMTDEDLKDLFLTLDLSVPRLTISPESWDATDYTEILI